MKKMLLLSFLMMHALPVRAMQENTMQVQAIRTGEHMTVDGKLTEQGLAHSSRCVVIHSVSTIQRAAIGLSHGSAYCI